jgi:hypothetical protein
VQAVGAYSPPLEERAARYSNVSSSTATDERPNSQVRVFPAPVVRGLGHRQSREQHCRRHFALRFQNSKCKF